jgi:hypothetical protein
MITVTVSGETPAELAGALALLLRSLSTSAPHETTTPLRIGNQPTGVTRTDYPRCPAHGSPLKRSKRGGGWYCPRQDDTGAYCKEGAA